MSSPVQAIRGSKGRFRRLLKFGLRAALLCLLLALVVRVTLPWIAPRALSSVAGMLGFEASFDDMHLRVVRGDLELWGLRVGPQHEEGETPAPFIELEYLALDIDMGSLLSARPRIRRMEVDGLELRLDRDERGRWALLEALAPLLASAESPPPAPEDADPSDPVALSSPIEITALRVSGAVLHLSDQHLIPALERDLRFSVRVSDVGSRESETLIELESWSPGALARARAAGRAQTGGDALSLDMKVEVSGFEPQAFEPYLLALGIRPVARGIDVLGRMQFLAQRPDPALDQVSVSLELGELSFEVDGVPEFSAQSFSLTIPSVGAERLELDAFQVEGVRGAAQLTADGHLRLAGFEFGGEAVLATHQQAEASSQQAEGGVEPSTPGPAEEPDASASESSFSLVLERVTGRDFLFEFEDSSLSPPVALSLQLDEYQLTQLIFDPTRAAQPASFTARGSMPGVIGELALEGSALISESGFQVDASTRAGAITLEALEPYLARAGIESQFEGGEFSAELAASGGLEDGVLSLDFGATEVRLRERAGAEPLFEVGAAQVRELRIDAARAEYSLGDAALTGLRIRIERDEQGALHGFGFKLGTAAEASFEHEVAKTEAPAPGQEPRVSGGVAQGTASSGSPPRLELRSVRWSDTHLEFIDRSVEQPSSDGQPFTQVFDDLEASLTGLVLGGEGERSPAKVALRASAGDFAERIELSGEFLTMPGEINLRGDLQLAAQGLSLLALDPYLSELQFQPELANGELSMTMSASLQQQAGTFIVSLALREVQLSEGEQRLAALGGLQVEDLRIDQGELRVPLISIEAPYLTASLDEAGALRLLGVRVLPRIPEEGGIARLPRVHELIDLAVFEALLSSIALGDGPAVRLDELALTRAGFDWQDLTVSPVVEARMSVDVGVRDFVLGREASPASFDIELGIDQTLESLRLSGELMPAPRHVSVRADILGEGLRSGVFTGYLPPGIEVHLTDGQLAAHLEVEGEEFEPGEYRAGAKLSGIEFSEASTARPYLAMESLAAELLRFSTEDNAVELGELSLKGLELELIRESEQVLSALGVRVDLAAMAEASAAQQVPETPSVSVTERAGTAAAIATRKAFPLVSVQALELDLARFSFLDQLSARGEPLDLSLNLSSSKPLVLLDANPEELAPLELHLAGAFPPVVGQVDVDFIAEPYVAEPRFRMDAVLGGLSAVGLVELLPQLADSIDGTQLTNGELGMKLDLVLRARRRGPTDYDLRSGFGLELEASDLALRDEPGGEILLGVDGIHVDVRKVRPLTGDVHISEVEILNPRGSATRERDGLRVAGVLLKTPEATEQVDSEPEPEVVMETAPLQVGEGPELRIDRFYITGMSFELADEAVVPAMRIPLDDVDFELRGLSTTGLQQGKPVRFNAIATASAITLPKRDAYGRLIELASGESSAWPGSSYDVEERPAFEEFSLTGELRTQPRLMGSVKVDLRGLELLNYSGASKDAGVEIQDGVLDSSVSMKINERGLWVDATSVFTWLSMSEGGDGPISSTLKLPAPLDAVIFITRNGSGENKIPVSFHIPVSGLSVSSLVATATATLAQVIAASVARSPFRIVGGVLDFTGITSDEVVARVQESTEFYFDPGAPRANKEQKDKLAALLDKVRKDDGLVLVLQHELGGGDLARCDALANPDPEWCREFAVRLRLEKARLWKQRERAAQDVRAEYAMGEVDRAEALAIELRALDAQLGRTEASLDNIYQLLRPGAERRREKRTKVACLELAKLRLAVARARLLAELGPEFADRLDIRRPRFQPSGGHAGGMVVITPKMR